MYKLGLSMKSLPSGMADFHIADSKESEIRTFVNVHLHTHWVPITPPGIYISEPITIYI